MGWFFGGLFFIGFIIYLVALFMEDVSFRKAIGVITFALVGLYFVLELQDEDEAKKSIPLAKAYVPQKIIKQSDIEVVNLRFNPKTYEYTGKVRNNSPYSLGKISIKFQVKDCLQDSKCEIVGEEYETINLDIPPAQARGMKGRIWFDNLPEIEKFEWDYKIYSMTAK